MKKITKSLLHVLLSAALTISLLGYSGDVTAAAKTKLITKTAKLTVGQSKKIVIKNKKKKAKYRFSSKSKKIATVTKNGKINAKKVGKTTVVVKQKYKKKTKKLGQIKITVSKKKTVIPSPSPVSTAKPSNTPSASPSTTTSKYASADNWAYLGKGEDKPVDVFLVGPTATFHNDGMNMDMNDARIKTAQLGALEMERGLYDELGRLYSPYYNQAAIEVFLMTDPVQTDPYLSIAYNDVKEAFLYYMEHYNNGRPIVLAGFSQGSEMLVRLMKELYGNEKYQKQLVAVYALGWRFSTDDLKKYPQLKMATGETDTGTIVSFTCESEELTTSMIVPGKTVGAINPLNWKTDSTKADKSLNIGACEVSYTGEITSETPELCGAYIDSDRGTLKVTDITTEQYPGIPGYLADGDYHIHDYLFFYRNIQENVKKRVNAFFNK